MTYALVGNSTPEIQQVLSKIEDSIRRSRSASALEEVFMQVDYGSAPIPHGSAVSMLGNSIVTLATAALGWAGVNVGPLAVGGDLILVRGGKICEVLFNPAAADPGVLPGALVYFDLAVPGHFTTIQPVGPAFQPAVAVIIDRLAYSLTAGGVVRVFLDSNFKAPDGVPVPPAFPPIALRTAFNYSSAAGSTITNTGPTTLEGDLGLSPGNSVTGFPPGTVTPPSVMHVADAAASQAKLDVTAAFLDGMSRVLNPIPVVADLGGQSLAPGLYTNATSMQITGGDLTLDGAPNPDGVWIFQMGTSLTVTTPRSVTLVGGAQAKNVFWVVGSSATIGVSSNMIGTIIAQASITMNTGATLVGRALTQTGAVTHDSNAVTMPPL